MKNERQNDKICNSNGPNGKLPGIASEDFVKIIFKYSVPKITILMGSFYCHTLYISGVTNGTTGVNATIDVDDHNKQCFHYHLSHAMFIVFTGILIASPFMDHTLRSSVRQIVSKR